MKEIKNWEPLILKDGKYQKGLPLPGCYISGELDGKNVIIQTINIDFSKLIIEDVNNIFYLLDGAKSSYLELLEDLIEFSKGKNFENTNENER